ncbi:hypothetical protein RclHR1_00150027 [Rhizophagus clarus]|uniref:High mobility group box domain-containing protein n=1 Tax=Rhizophagus clarus TaxID=94130 RepID=A0A2Z6QUR6_9GLOM|nr:hypothetical protein RclHR1_00150027 [Rhizophagus clarus]GET02310.1 high mobility group box domain-containing protein [Rhizophagus clarus]
MMNFQPGTDEEIVVNSTYNFNLDIEILLNTSFTPRRARHIQRLHLAYHPRPPNPFILYRKDKAVGPEFVGLKTSELSRRIADMWRNESAEVKDLFHALARMAKRRYWNTYNYH